MQKVILTATICCALMACEQASDEGPITDSEVIEMSSGEEVEEIKTPDRAAYIDESIASEIHWNMDRLMKLSMPL